MITDTHAHVFYDSFDTDRAQVLARAREAGVTRMLVVGTNLETSRAALELSSRESGLFPTAGVHPHDAGESTALERSGIEALARDTRIVGVGETGLDFFRNLSTRDAQLDNFRWHLALAREVAKPVIVHCRDAHEATVELLREARGVAGVMHCYSMGVEELAPYLELGFYISFSGVVTYPKNERIRAAARAVPRERLVVETDSPYLAPQGQRGRRNEPAFAREVLAVVARERGDDFDELARATSENASRLFGLD